jgi:hypothetical protein
LGVSSLLREEERIYGYIVRDLRKERPVRAEHSARAYGKLGA